MFVATSDLRWHVHSARPRSVAANTTAAGTLTQVLFCKAIELQPHEDTVVARAAHLVAEPKPFIRLSKVSISPKERRKVRLHATYGA